MKLRISTGNSRMEKKWNLTELDLTQFRDRVSQTHRTAETVEQYRKLGSSSLYRPVRFAASLFLSGGGAGSGGRTAFRPLVGQCLYLSGRHS